MGRKPMLSRGSAMRGADLPAGGLCIGKALSAPLVLSTFRGDRPTATGQTIRAERHGFRETVLLIVIPAKAG
ncbi:MAG: hypothetical protein KJ824_01820, partial [Alphaproteobacteria bacterium]|nr:hypothetical protein [Alphaproteobacteria bacterium]